MPRKRKRPLDSRIDYTVILPVFLLILIGIVAIYTATSHDNSSSIVSVIIQQVVGIVVGCAIAFIVMFFDVERLWKLTPYLYGSGLVLMVLPLFIYSPALVASTGAKNWVSIGSVSLFQPSEFMKIAYILMLARMGVWFKDEYKEEEPSLKKDGRLILIYLAVTAPVLLLLVLQKDMGTAMVFMAILAGLIVLSGVSWRIILSALLVAGLGFGLFLLIFTSDWGKEWLYHMGMETYKINRVAAWLDPFAYESGIAYQQVQGLISIGSGGLLGKGFNVAELSIPVRESDMIFTVIAEDYGFIGSIVVILLYLILIFRMIRITIESNNVFNTYIATGFIMMILFHVFENIGAAIGVLPLTGIPLPFISKGGSSLMSNLIGVGLVLSMSYQNSLAKERRIDKDLSRSSWNKYWI
ncbi:FtsW/RodA/SpoVE family cell cycle protein [Streptococcus sobrinus]|uniref:Cell cycle protein, FtsW/RodA/SpoVE family n=17 Tax=Streptococcus sobrinus TaxID=1310 RepID=U2KGR9_9STRE|nr:FtsW/RodA/SpoVE family cell cycle protein [Streptococcus sobrinus]AWN18596.1 FtsW/RodA/SpoVE family cell cycle protein [Streptococcus sobrinus]AWN21097.1 FtsW/RodA/SpoVE family cell cycle protein [Streptococcus sobrinus]AWN61933.1 FtsW/RodA/SpoVE family cell cycle protein [Streptococcus sobrinus]AWN63804.1 FtsW/RodA/SpoVE family cell cycle protein [Streptococcus sobrinus]EMP71463.1 rod shape determining protein [Streptococcus sobrinus DSM 20742 = ATCC 33478]